MPVVDCYRVLTEASIDVNRGEFLTLSEEARLQVTDDVLTGLMKFITDKYNSLDFSEIERSAGDIDRFKYKSLIMENSKILKDIYESSQDPGARKYLDVIYAVDEVMRFLGEDREKIAALYRSGNGIIQLMYTSLVAACLYSIGILVSNTIRFVTTDQDADCTVMFDEIPGTIKHVHIKNVLAARSSINDMHQLVKEYHKQSKLSESVEAIAIGALITGFVIYLIPKIIILIREIIYSIYFHRVKTAEMIGVQIDLLNVNIESLEAGRGNKKVIARQKNIVEKLKKWQNRVAVKNDMVNSMVLTQKNRENQSLKIDKNSPIVRDPGSFNASDLMI